MAMILYYVRIYFLTPPPPALDMIGCCKLEAAEGVLLSHTEDIPLVNQALAILAINRVRNTAKAPIAPCRPTSTVLGLWISAIIKISNIRIRSIRSQYPHTSILFTQIGEKEYRQKVKHNASRLIA